MELMDDEELEGVIAHELSHVRNYDILTSSIAATIAGAITCSMARMGFWFGGGGDDRDRGGALTGASDADPRAASPPCCCSLAFPASANIRRTLRARRWWAIRTA